MSPSVNDPFLSHLMRVLTMFETESIPTPLPTYDGPQDGQTDAIQRSLALLARRMHTAEDMVASIKANDSAGPTEQRHSSDNAPITPTPMLMDDAPVTISQAAEYPCPTCGRRESSLASSGLAISPSPVVPPGPFNAAAFDGSMGAVEELELLKAQILDITRVCKVVPHPLYPVQLYISHW